MATADRDFFACARTRIGIAALVVAGAAAGLAATGGPAAALPNCGGNNDIKVAPVTCTNTRTIDGTTFTVVLDVSSGGAVTATYTLDAPRAVDTPIRMRAHRGISSSPATNEAAGTIPAGATSATLSTGLMCGQIDVKAVYTGNGDARGRIAAPYVTNTNDCQTTPTTAPTTAPTTGPTSVPTTPGSSVSPTTVPAGSTTPTSASSGQALPVTGSGGTLLVVAGLATMLGLVLVTRGRDRRRISD